MTAYFDDIDDRIRKLRNAPDQGEYDAIEDTLVNDATIASEFPEFPEDLRDEVRRAILRFGIESLPEFVEKPDFVLNPGEWAEDDYQNRLHALSSTLHTIFHEIGNRAIPGISDDPRSWPRLQLYRGAVARDRIAEIERWGNVRAEAEARGWRQKDGAWVDGSGQRRVWISYDDARWRCSADTNVSMTAEGEALRLELNLTPPPMDPVPKMIKPPLPARFDPLVARFGEERVREILDAIAKASP